MYLMHISTWTPFPTQRRSKKSATHADQKSNTLKNPHQNMSRLLKETLEYLARKSTDTMIRVIIGIDRTIRLAVNQSIRSNKVKLIQ